MSDKKPMEKALLVEDDPLVQEIVVGYLHRNKFNVDTVGSAEAALDNMAGNDYLFMITDLALPGMNGFELIRKVKNLIPDMPIAVTTGNKAGLDRSLLSLVDNLVLEKPFRSSDFDKFLAQLMERLSKQNNS